jgi:hypothetical protein
MPEQREGRRVNQALLVAAAVIAAVTAVFFLVPRSPPSPPPSGRGEPTVCRLTRGGETVARLQVGAAAAPARAGDVVRCTVAPSFREYLEVWAQPGDQAPVQISSQPVSGSTELAGMELPEGRTRIYLLRSDRPPTPEQAREVIAEGGKTPRLRVEVYAVDAR